jgi:hypothetical protein
MKNTLKLAIATIIVTLLSACGLSDKEMAIYRECANSVKYLDIYQKDGTHFSETVVGESFTFRICSARAKLYVKGYRIKKIAQQDDYYVWQNYLRSDHEPYYVYKKMIQSGIEP